MSTTQVDLHPRLGLRAHRVLRRPHPWVDRAARCRWRATGSGGLLLAVYALGMVMPLDLLALTWGSIWQRVNGWLRGRTIHAGRFSFHSTSLISGLMLVAVGAFMIMNGGNLVESNTLPLAGARAEEWAPAWAAACRTRLGAGCVPRHSSVDVLQLATRQPLQYGVVFRTSGDF